MNQSPAIVTYLAVYFITIIYLVVLGCCMLWHKDNPLSTHGELAAKRRMSRTMGVAMFVVALLLLAAWQIIAPPKHDIILYISAALSLASYLFLLIEFASEYRLFLRRLRSEYSDTTNCEIAWSLISFSAFAVQGILFILYELAWTPALRLGTNRTYMGMYFHERNLTFYQYINTLRIEYAFRLMQDDPQFSLRKVAEQSGFRSQPTFRKVFQEVKTHPLTPSR